MYHQQRGLGGPLGFPGDHYVQIILGSGRTEPFLYFLGHRHFTFNQNSVFSVTEE